jgi:hypothetical protein
MTEIEELKRKLQTAQKRVKELEASLTVMGATLKDNGDLEIDMASYHKAHCAKCAQPDHCVYKLLVEVIDEQKQRISASQARVRELEAEAEAGIKMGHEIEQILGKALGYPWYKDDQQNFPGATEADGVCVGEHVAESIAAEAANRIAQLEAELAKLRGNSND